MNAVELELDNLNGANGALPQFIAALQSCTWVAVVKQEGNLLRVMVQDVPLGKKELLSLIDAHRLVLNRYEWVRPSLEEIFLQLSA